MSGTVRLLFLLAALLLHGCSSPTHPQRRTIAHPANPRAQIEYFVERPSGRGPWPTIVFLHGYQPPPNSKGGRAFVDWGVLSDQAREGYLAVSVSLPGYGGSGGPADFAGPFSQRAVRTVIARLEADGEAMPNKVLIEGTSLGAVTAALIAADDPALAGLVLISGLYDLPAFLLPAKSAAAAEIKAVALAQAGEDPAALEARSALRGAARIRAATLILNGMDDDRTDPAQARQFAAAIHAGGGTATVRIYDGVGHRIPVHLRAASIKAHVESVLR
jgi:dipeptidyl aminopeptidase/acylaminoacyl peptidase